MARRICDATDPSTASYDNAKVWFQKAKNGDLDVEDQPRFGRPIAVDKDRVMELVQEDPRRAPPVIWQRNSSAFTLLALERHGDIAHRYRVILAGITYRCAGLHARTSSLFGGVFLGSRT